MNTKHVTTCRTSNYLLCFNMPALAQTIHRWLTSRVFYNDCKEPGFRCSGTRRCVNGSWDKEISKQCTALILKAQQVLQVLRKLDLIDLSARARARVCVYVYLCVCVCVCVYIYISGSGSPITDLDSP